MKELHAAYNENGFEIVPISIDDDHDDREVSSVANQLPWINLGEMVDYIGSVAIPYGEGGLPTSYLLDSQACILQKNIEHQQLEELLSDAQLEASGE